MATVLHPGRLSPTRQVPADIPRPEYVGKKHPRTGEPDVKTPEIIEFWPELPRTDTGKLLRRTVVARLTDA